MPPEKYRKIPVEIEAIRWTGENLTDVSEFTNGRAFLLRGELVTNTLEGIQTSRLGDYIIRGVCGECYPCRADIFEQTYERIDE